MTSNNREKLVDEILILADRLFRQLLPTIPKELLTLDVTMPQMKIILMLHFNGSMRMSDIANAMEVTMPTATSLVERLVKKKYVNREADITDRRVVLCQLDVDGQKAVRGIWDSTRKQSKEILRAMDTQKLSMFTEVLEEMLKTASPKVGEE